MSASATDRQGERLYRLTGEFGGSCYWDRATAASLRELAVDVCKYYNKLPVPAIRFVTRPRDATPAWFTPPNEITINRGYTGSNCGNMLHELAHYVTESYYHEDTIEMHGPEFCAIFMHLLDTYNIFPHECFRLLAKKHRVRIGRRFRPRAFK